MSYTPVSPRDPEWQNNIPIPPLAVGDLENKTSNTSATSTKAYRIRLLVALFLPVFLETLDYTVVATAQPHIAVR